MNQPERFHNAVNSPMISIVNQSAEQLLDDWDNRPSAFWGEDSAKRTSNNIRLLEALQNCGCQKTRDGWSVAMQLDACRIALRDIMRAREGWD